MPHRRRKPRWQIPLIAGIVAAALLEAVKAIDWLILCWTLPEGKSCADVAPNWLGGSLLGVLAAAAVATVYCYWRAFHMGEHYRNDLGDPRRRG